jgi:hypothetical protein
MERPGLWTVQGIAVATYEEGPSDADCAIVFVHGNLRDVPLSAGFLISLIAF